MSANSIVCYAQIKPITGLTIEQKRELVKYKYGYQYQALDIDLMKQRLEQFSIYKTESKELESLLRVEIRELKDIIELKEVKIQSLENVIEIKQKTRVNWFLVVLSFIVGGVGGYYIGL